MNKKNKHIFADLISLKSVGKAISMKLNMLGIDTVGKLKGKDAFQLYKKLNKLTGKRHDPCVIDVFLCAIAQAEDVNLSSEKKNWWYWTKYRKSKINLF